MPFVFGLIILMTLRSVVFGEMSNVVDLFALYSLLRRLLDRLVLVSALRVRAQSRSARASAHQAVYANADRREANRELPRSEFSAWPARICSACRFAHCSGRLVFTKGDTRMMNQLLAVTLCLTLNAGAATLQERIDAAAPN